MKRLFLSILLSACTWVLSAQDMASSFIAMPDRNIPQLENAWRKDLIDLYNSGKEAKLKNTMNGFSTLQKLTPDYLLLQTTEHSTVEMRLLPLVNNTNVICVITTVKGPVEDSLVEFYTTGWEPLATADLFTPEPADWFIKEGTDRTSNDFIEAASRLDMELIKYSLSPDDLTLTETYTTPLYLDPESRKKIEPFLKESPRVFRWEKSHFK